MGLYLKKIYIYIYIFRHVHGTPPTKVADSPASTGDLCGAAAGCAGAARAAAWNPVAESRDFILG